MNNEMATKAESLSVYTEKKWIPNKEEIEDMNKKDGPTFAKVKTPSTNSTSKKNISVTVLNDN